MQHNGQGMATIKAHFDAYRQRGLRGNEEDQMCEAGTSLTMGLNKGCTTTSSGLR